MASQDAWTEGLPTEPGDYWIYSVRLGGPKPRVEQGRTFVTGNDVLMHVAGGVFLYERNLGPKLRVWHRPLELPEEPEFDRTCPSCGGKGDTWGRKCYDCNGTGKIC